MAEFAYNNTMHSSTQQTPVFANHGLYPNFDIQGVHKVTNLVAKELSHVIGECSSSTCV
jgi:hypothetical protein